MDICKIHRISQQVFAYIPFFSFGQVINFINHCQRICDVTVFAILIQISFKLIHVYRYLHLLNILIHLNNPLLPQPLILLLIPKCAMNSGLSS